VKNESGGEGEGGEVSAVDRSEQVNYDKNGEHSESRKDDSTLSCSVLQSFFNMSSYPPTTQRSIIVNPTPTMSSLSFSSIEDGLSSDLIHRIELADPNTSLGNDRNRSIVLCI